MKGPARTVFLGSGGFAVPILKALRTQPNVELVAVVTAPPRPAGRDMRLTASPVGALAERLDMTVLRPDRLRDTGTVEALAALRPDLLVLADYGRLVPAAILALPPRGALNLHPSLLPRHRGAAPIQAAIVCGDGTTGVTLMRMNEGIDSGPIVSQRSLPLVGDETAVQLEEALAGLAAVLLAESLPGWLAGTLPAVPQPAAGATLTRPLRREDGRLDPWRHGAALLERRVRAFQPWPGTWLEVPSGRIAVLSARVAADSSAGAGGEDRSVTVSRAGTLALDDDSGLALETSAGRLALIRVRPAGGREMSSQQLIRGRPGLVGSRVTAPSTAAGSADAAGDPDCVG